MANEKQGWKKAVQWLCIVLVIGLLVGSTSALFLVLLDQMDSLRKQQQLLYYALPLLGVLIAWMYSKLNFSNGNQLIHAAYFDSSNDVNKKRVPLLLTPLVLIGTLLTHLGGGSAGREGTAVQMGASMASQINRWFNLNETEQRLVIAVGVSAGFAGVFGTPIAASVFAFEFFGLRKTKWHFIFPSLLVAYLANYICLLWGIQHTAYKISTFDNFDFAILGWVSIAGIFFGLAAFLFIQSGILFTKLAHQIKSPYLRPAIGGVLIAACILYTGQEKMAGLGLPVIADAFVHQQAPLDFLIKLLLTSFTLSVGFKGGEVTPLFFIGAVLGSALVLLIPLPISLLVGLGLVAVFAGATHCVVTAIVLGIELFGVNFTIYISIACVVAYLFAGNKSIYEGRPTGWFKKAISSYFLKTMYT
jgi:H+/Cl- antiporter ClcA